MRVMVIVKATKDSEAGVPPSTELLTEMSKFNEELVKAGVLLSAAGLRPSSHGVRVRFGAGKAAVIDGPFTETKELIGGFWLWQVKSIEEAIEWIRRAPFRKGDRQADGSVCDAEVEIRPMFEADECGGRATAELLERQADRRASLTAKI
jgi:hypothetical protein